MSGYFDPEYFDAAYFDTGDTEPNPPGGGGHAIGPVRVRARRIPGTEDEFLVWWLVTFLLLLTL